MSSTEVEIPSKSAVSAMNRADLDALGESLGLTPSDYGTRAEIITAIENLRDPEPVVPEELDGDEYVGSAGLDADGTPVYPYYMGLVAGERDPLAEEVAPTITGLQLLWDGENNPTVGDTIAFNTDSEDPNEILRVWVAANDEDQTPLFSKDMPAGPGRTQPFVLGLTSLWTEHGTKDGLGVAKIFTVDPETGEETPGEFVNFIVGEEPDGPPA